MSAEEIRHAWKVKFDLERKEVDRILATYYLAPCPWCGKSPTVRYDSKPDVYDPYYLISCSDPDCPASCYCSGNAIDLVVEHWNTRHNEEDRRPIQFEEDFCEIEFE